MMKFFLIFIFFANSKMLLSQSKNWNGKKCAVVLTYDDGYDQQLDNAIPILDSLKLKATFYLSGFFPAVKNRIAAWKTVAKNGHELGNHTLFHPCDGGKGREWVAPENDLTKYTVARMENEIKMTNVFLNAIDGKNKRTFAFTCGDMKIGDSSFINGLKNDVVAARAVRNEMHNINEVDLYNIDCYMVNNHSFEQMKELVDKAIQSNSLLVILFHGVGGGNSLDVSLSNHRAILQYIKKNEKNIYCAPMFEIANYINKTNKKD